MRACSPPVLWTSQRLDIAVKLLYARHYLQQIGEPRDISIRALYRRHILLRTNGREPGSDSKTSLDRYELEFRQLIDSIRLQGFQPDGAIPLHHDGRILNGAHRIAAAIALGITEIPTVAMEAGQAYDWGMNWFLQQDFTPHEINALLNCWLDAKQASAGIIMLGASRAQWPQLTVKIAGTAPLVAWRDIWLSEQSLAQLQETGMAPPGNDDCGDGIVCRVHWLDTDIRMCRQIAARIQAEGVHATSSETPVQTKALAGILLDEHRLALQRQQLPQGQRNGVRMWLQASRPERQAHAGKWKNLELLEKVQTVIDVGVAYGTPDLYAHLNPDHVVFVEPVPYFKGHIEKLMPQFRSSQYFEVGLANEEGSATINYRKDAPILTSMLGSSPLRDTGTEQREKLDIKLTRLDRIFPGIKHPGGNLLLKIDSEGYELEILKGSVQSLPRIKYIMLEVSVIKRFENSYTCQELMGFLNAHGFMMFTCLSASMDDDGYCRVIDAVFVNVRN